MVMASVQKVLKLLFDLPAFCVSFFCGLIGNILSGSDCLKFEKVPCYRCGIRNDMLTGKFQKPLVGKQTAVIARKDGTTVRWW